MIFYAGRGYSFRATVLPGAPGRLAMLEAEDYVYVNDATSFVETTDPSSATMQRNAEHIVSLCS